jgi:ribokinase
MNANAKPVVVVVGSLHYDIMVDAPDRPRKGETVTGHAWRPKFGGKGGNQAVAAAAAGADVRMAGAVGTDDFGKFLLHALAAGGVDTSHVTTVGTAGSGMSIAITDADGDYGAVIVSGANLRIDPEAIATSDIWHGSKALILQNEIPEPVNIAAAKAARAAGALVCLNAAPYRTMSDELLGLIDILIVNAIEAEQLGGNPVADLAAAGQAAVRLAQRFPMVVVTAGGDGVAGATQAGPTVLLPALPVKLVSTHGAGDVFVGVLATALAAGGRSFADCLAAANQGAAAHVSKPVE